MRTSIPSTLAMIAAALLVSSSTFSKEPQRPTGSRSALAITDDHIPSGPTTARRTLTGTSPNEASSMDLPTCPMKIDSSFAELILRARAGQEGVALNPTDEKALLKHPAMDLLVAHQRMSGNPDANPRQLLAHILAQPLSPEAQRVLDYWTTRSGALCDCISASLDLLPKDSKLGSSLYLVVGYDIGVATPKGIAVNVAHPRFLTNPAELGPIVTHEFHHTGFMAWRPPPPLQGLDDPTTLAGLVRYFTQLEGMAVHAAYAWDQRQGEPSADPDYAVYRDPAVARSTVSRYAQVLAMLDHKGPLKPETIGKILGAMSSGERLWYRFGALVSRELERTGGHAALVASVQDSEAFHLAAQALLQRGGPEQPR